MKKIFAILLAFWVSGMALSQSCLPEGITFSNQNQIDSFQFNYPGCTEIDGDVLINGTDITNLNGLSILTECNGNLLIEGNVSLTSLAGLHNLNSIGGQFPTNHDVLTISHNDLLTDLTGLNNLAWLGGGCKIYDNESLINLNGLDSLSFIGENLTIDHNLDLTSLTGLEAVNGIGGSLIIESSLHLESLSALSNLTSISGGISIHSTRITNLTGFEGLTFIAGDLSLAGNGHLINLTGLDNVTIIGGTLRIGELAGVSNYSLVSLTGLNSVTKIMGNLSIICNEALKSLTGLNILSSVGGYVSIFMNDSLASLSGFDSLILIQGDLRVYENNALSSLTALSSLNSINGSLLVANNPSLGSLNGLDNISAGSISNLTIRSNQSLSTCEVQSICDYLSSPNGIVEIYENNPGCDNPHEIAEQCGISLPCLPNGNYYFFSQSEIDSFQSNYPGCNNIEGDVYISGNDITDLIGLKEVTSISGSLYIQNNAVLTSLAGLDNLISIGEYLMIDDNTSLNSLSGLNNLIAGTLSILYIRDNPALSYCEAEGICNILAMDIETISIHGNAPGCSSRAEVEAACGVGLTENILFDKQCKIYPNPASDELHIESSEGMESVCVFDSQGDKVIGWYGDKVDGWSGGQVAGGSGGQVVKWSGGQGKVAIPVRGLASGLYLVRVETKSGMVMRKVVVGR
jgi:hypothetical protein